MNRRQIAVAIVASLALHLVVALTLFRGASQAPSSSPPRDPIWIAVERVQLERGSNESPPQDAPPDSAPRASPAKKRAPRNIGARAAEPAPAKPSKDTSEALASTGPARERSGKGSAAPQPQATPPEPTARGPSADAAAPELSLAPSAEFVARLNDAADPPARGRTLPGAGDEKPTRGASVHAVKANVEGWSEDDRAAARVEEGRSDQYFGDLRQALVREAERLQTPSGKELVAAMDRRLTRFFITAAQSFGDSLTEWSDELPVYGATGNPGGQAKPEPVPSDKLTKTFDLTQFTSGRTTMVAWVELVQAKDGKLMEMKLLKRSKDPLFDKYVLELASKVVSDLPPPPERALSRGEVVRSQWEFRGVYNYVRKLSELKVESAISTILTTLTGLGSLTFDETTGDVWGLAPTAPELLCKVRLLRAY